MLCQVKLSSGSQNFQKASGLNDFEKAEGGSFGENDGGNCARAVRSIAVVLMPYVHVEKLIWRSGC